MPNKKKAPAQPYGAPDKSKYDAFIDEAAKEHGLDRWLLRSLIWKESGDNPNAWNETSGATGLAQIVPSTFNYIRTGLKYKDVNNIRDPRDNIRAGAKYLRYLMDKFQNPTMAIAAYNAGPGNVRRYGGIPPFAETKDYVNKVMGDYRKFKDREKNEINNQVIKQAQRHPLDFAQPNLGPTMAPLQQAAPMMQMYPEQGVVDVSLFNHRGRTQQPTPPAPGTQDALNYIPGGNFVRKLLGR